MTPAKTTPIIKVIYDEKELIVSLVVLAIFPTKSFGNVINVNIIGYIRGYQNTLYFCIFYLCGKKFIIC
jgi:hypothetical protein